MLYNPATGLIELRCGHCGNAEEIPTRLRARHEYGFSLPLWIAASAPRWFSYGAWGNCALRGRVSWHDLVCSECGNMSTSDD